MNNLFNLIKEHREATKLFERYMGGELEINDIQIEPNDLSDKLNFLEDQIDSIIEGKEVGDMSDGYHTFNELYDHRLELYKQLADRVYLIELANHILGHQNNHIKLIINRDENGLAIPKRVDAPAEIPPYRPRVWKSKRHSDGSSYPGWFIMGINYEPGQQISYHMPLSYWERCNNAVTLDRAPDFDGHTPADVLNRMKEGVLCNEF